MADRFSRLHDTTGVSREEASFEVDMSPATLADEAAWDASRGRPTVGTAGDEAEVTSEIHRKQFKARRGPNES